MCRHEEVPQAWNDVTIEVLHKEGPTEYGDCRGIALVAYAGRVLLKVSVACRLCIFCEQNRLLPEGQRSFRPGRSTVDMIFVMRRQQELAQDKNSPVYACFIDLQKVHDSADHTILWEC